jgi:hypothetical protein
VLCIKLFLTRLLTLIFDSNRQEKYFLESLKRTLSLKQNGFTISTSNQRKPGNSPFLDVKLLFISQDGVGCQNKDDSK